MSAKTLNSVPSIVVEPMVGRSPLSKALTYSLESQLTSVPAKTVCLSTPELESFLEGENPLGCFRGVMWVMGFNAAVFLLGFVIWQSWKFLR
jgi:hypothetical protein